MVRKYIAFFIMLLFACCNGAWAVDSQQGFIDSLLPSIRSLNKQLAKKHERLTVLFAKKKGELSHHESKWLQSLASQYRLESFDIKNSRDRQELLSRVDIIPASLVLAQAAIESNWGRSRFAKEGNNYFGEHCYHQGCGIVPHNRAPGNMFEVEVFTTKKDSIASYMHNLNTYSVYKGLRSLRANARSRGNKISGIDLIPGLIHYSTKQNDYLKSVRKLIEQRDLEQYDV